MTRIYKSYQHFLNRKNKSDNGVSTEFATLHPLYVADNETNIGCWNCKSCIFCESCISCESCKSCKSCEYCISCIFCEYCKSCIFCESCKSCESCIFCESCESCIFCKSCKSCIFCEYCISCESCEYCISTKGLQSDNDLIIPTIKNIHQQVYESARQPKALNMTTWHTCDTTHCRAGWVVALAGEEGAILERNTSTSFAAMAIYNKSSEIKVGLHQFYLGNKESLADMKRCAELEVNNDTRRSY